MAHSDFKSTYRIGGEMSMVGDQAVQSAVSRILQRAERQDSADKVLDTFVDVGFLPQLHNRNNQVFYGRRGTGKTHVLRVLEARLRGDDQKNTVVYVDCRTLGSTAQFSDLTLPLSRRCIALFRDILGEIHGALLQRIFDEPDDSASSDPTRALKSLDALSAAISQPVETHVTESVTETTEAGTSDSASAGVTANITGGLGAQANVGTDESRQGQKVRAVRVETEDKVLFPYLHKHFSDVLQYADTSLYILLDEWSSLPTDIQPYLAEFLKRSVLPVQKAVLKVASLEYRSRFALTNEGTLFGFELGADVSTTQDLDEYYVFDRNPEKITDEYANMLLRHLNGELPTDYLSEEYRVRTGTELATKLFTDRNTFKELARACEGVVRDLINIFSLAFNHAFRNDRRSIDRKALLAAAQQWFEQDKANSLDDHLQTVLRKIVDEVIGTRNARSFLLPRHLERNAVVQKLFDARVLHHMQRGYADKDNPGVRYNIYTLDYGTYVGLMGTVKQPIIDLFDTSDGSDMVVPFDDKRSIRRIILDESVLA